MNRQPQSERTFWSCVVTIVMLVEMNTNFVLPQRCIINPNDVFNSTIARWPYIHVDVKFTSTFTCSVVEVNTFTRRAEEMEVKVVVIIPRKRYLHYT